MRNHAHGGAAPARGRLVNQVPVYGDAQKYPYHQPSLAADYHSALSKSKRRQFLGGDPANSSSAVVVYAAVVQMWAVGDRSFLLYSAR